MNDAHDFDGKDSFFVFRFNINQLAIKRIAVAVFKVRIQNPDVKSADLAVLKQRFSAGNADFIQISEPILLKTFFRTLRALPSKTFRKGVFRGREYKQSTPRQRGESLHKLSFHSQRRIN